MLRRLCLCAFMIICIGGIVSMQSREVTYMDCRSGFSLFADADDECGSGLRIDSKVRGSVIGGDGDVVFVARLRSEGRGFASGYGIYLANEDGDTVRLYMNPCVGLIDPLREEEQSLLRLEVGGETVVERKLSVNVLDNRTGYNTLSLGRKGGALEVRAGREGTERIVYLAEGTDFFSGNITEVGISAGSGNVLVLERAQLEVNPSIGWRLSTGLSGDEVAALVSEGKDGVCGRWTLLDFDVDDRYMRCGGSYRVGVVSWGDVAGLSPDFASRFDFPADALAMIYTDGARVDRYRWKPGMLKGVMLPTLFRSVWRLIWFDSVGERVDAESVSAMSTATLEDEGCILRLSFPERYSSMRFVKTE